VLISPPAITRKQAIRAVDISVKYGSKYFPAGERNSKIIINKKAPVTWG
jgi:hypothetical protein